MGHENGGWMNDDQRSAKKDAARAVTVASQDSPGPLTHDEAKQFHEGFLAGATAYAAAVGHSTLKSDNPKLCDVFDAQGWRTIEIFEKLQQQCEHGIKLGDWCEPCNKSMKQAQEENQWHLYS